MSGNDDSKLLAHLAELKRQREAGGKSGAGARLTPASADERRARLRAMREKRMAQHESEDVPPGAGAGGKEGGRGGLLRALAEKRAKDGARDGGGAEGERRGEFLKRVLARRQTEAPATEAAGGGERPLAGLLRRRMGGGDGAGASAVPEDARKTRERLEKMIRKLEDRLEQLDGKPAEEVTVIDATPVAAVPGVETLEAGPEK